jgi:hypothetical protein
MIATAGWAGVAIDLVRITAREGSVLAALWRMLFFFTNVANFACAAVYTAIALGSVRLRHPLLVAGLAMIMALVGIVFEALLRARLDPTGWRAVATALQHDVVPVLAVAAWFALAEKGQLRPHDPWRFAALPLAYLPYALVRGALEGRYPYPFLDVAQLGGARVALNALGIALGFLLVGYALVALDRVLGERR